jgi:hypothetical protein
MHAHLTVQRRLAQSFRRCPSGYVEQSLRTAAHKYRQKEVNVAGKTLGRLIPSSGRLLRRSRYSPYRWNVRWQPKLGPRWVVRKGEDKPKRCSSLERRRLGQSGSITSWYGDVGHAWSGNTLAPGSRNVERVLYCWSARKSAYTETMPYPI